MGKDANGLSLPMIKGLCWPMARDASKCEHSRRFVCQSPLRIAVLQLRLYQ